MAVVEAESEAVNEAEAVAAVLHCKDKIVAAVEFSVEIPLLESFEDFAAGAGRVANQKEMNENEDEREDERNFEHYWKTEIELN